MLEPKGGGETMVDSEHTQRCSCGDRQVQVVDGDSRVFMLEPKRGRKTTGGMRTHAASSVVVGERKLLMETEERFHASTK